ncbi:MAG: hypothetical protein PUB73_06505 [Bacteroidales bacterium]|nr:hypothetical protein [Bacteroidales bacterium]MDY5823385.1 hypothetical protein [Candidatus Coprenecus sp.]
MTEIPKDLENNVEHLINSMSLVENIRYSQRRDSIGRKIALYSLSAAASVVLIITVALSLTRVKTPRDTFDDPILAYMEVEKVMSKINDHISVPAGTISMTEDILNKQKTIFNTTIKR